MSDLKVTVLTKPDCVGCKFTKQEMDKLEIQYLSRDVTQDPEAYALVMQYGYSGLPVVVVEQGENLETWTGFSPDRIKAIKNYLVEN
nr:glutaredoxin domain-containing protein [Rhodococcus sp. (in: high G+C Gram-positive bacteria)]